MSIFDRFENAVERGVNGAFSRVFRSGIKPVDITTAIRRAMDDSVQEVSASRIIAANHFTVYASREDLFSLEASLDVLADEFAQQATEHASNNDYSLLGPVSIEFVADSTEVAGTLKVAAETAEVPQPPPLPRLPPPNTPSSTSTVTSGCSPNPSPSSVAAPKPTSSSMTPAYRAATSNFASPPPE